MGYKSVPLLAIFCAALLHHWSWRARCSGTLLQGKTVRFLINFSAGGPTDVFGRLIARYFSKHFAGNPAVVVQNMSGAGGIIGANYVYEIAKPDGSRWGFSRACTCRKSLAAPVCVTTSIKCRSSPAPPRLRSSTSALTRR